MVDRRVGRVRGVEDGEQFGRQPSHHVPECVPDLSRLTLRRADQSPVLLLADGFRSPLQQGERALDGRHRSQQPMGRHRHGCLRSHPRQRLGLSARQVQQVLDGERLIGELCQGQGLRPGEGEPLGPVDPDAAQRQYLPLGLDALCHDRCPDLAREDHQGGREGSSRRVGVDCLGDRAIHLDDVGTQAQHVAEGGVARAGVVDRQTDAAFPEDTYELLRLGVIGDPGVLCHLHHDPGARDPRSDQEVGDAGV